VVLLHLLRVLAASTAIGIVVATPFFVSHGRANSIVLAVVVASVYVALALLPLRYRVRSLTFVIAMAVGASVVTSMQGLDVGPVLADLVLPFLAVLFIGPRAAIVAAAWCIATNATVAILELHGVLHIPPNPTAMRMDPRYWPMLTLAQTFTGGPVIYIAHQLMSRLERALAEEQRTLADLRRVHQSVAATERLKTLGLLAGAIAHDLNNTLTVIAGEVELADGLAAEARESILQATAGASQLARQVLLSAGTAVAQLRPTDLHAALRPSIKALARLMPENITVSLPAPPTDTLAVVADPVILQQVLLNLAINARDAMPQGGELTLTLEAGERHGRRFAAIEVRDNGQGMNADTLARATEPFFTTKERGLGTGLGLSNVRSAIEEFGGELEIESAPKQGTSVRIWMPLIERGLLGNSEPTGVASGEGKRLMLVEDNLRVRAIAFEILQRAGYEVLEAGSVTRANELLGSVDSLDVLVCDLVLPDGGGLEFARTLRQKFPDSAIVITSGYAPEPADREALARHEFRYLAKPFGAVALTKAVAGAMSIGSN
jgi:signal transduction histidine kinase/CheY-like chemotaxis protein